MKCYSASGSEAKSCQQGDFLDLDPDSLLSRQANNNGNLGELMHILNTCVLDLRGWGTGMNMQGQHLLQRNSSGTFCHLLGFGFWSQWQEGGAGALVSGLWETGVRPWQASASHLWSS